MFGQWFYFKWFLNKNHCASLVHTMLLFIVEMFLPSKIAPRYWLSMASPTHSHFLINTTHSICIQFIKLSYCSDYFSKTATTWKVDKYNCLLNTIRLWGLNKHKLESQSPLNLDSHGYWSTPSPKTLPHFSLPHYQIPSPPFFPSIVMHWLKFHWNDTPY
jgi:hypothetical protein